MPQIPFWLHVGISILFAVALSLLDLVEVAVVRQEQVVGLFIGPIRRYRSSRATDIAAKIGAAPAESSRPIVSKAGLASSSRDQ
jgi:hypothetical protein